MSEDEEMSQAHHFTVKGTASLWRHRKKEQPQQAEESLKNEYDGVFDEHMENYSVEATALHRKLQSKMEALRILRKELEKFRTERDQFKLMAETLQLRYAALRRSSLSDFSGSLASEDGSGMTSVDSKSSVAKILHETRERNIKLTTEVESLKQKLTEVQGDIEVLRANKNSKDSEIKETLPESESGEKFNKDLQLKWKEERSNFISHLEQLKKKNAQLAFDFKAIIDEKEELTNERDAYKCKAHRLNHELLIALEAKDIHPKFLDIDSIILENKYLHERLKNTETEIELTKQSVNKYKSLLENKRKKGIMKMGNVSNNDGKFLSHKQVKNLLENGIDLPTKTETIQDLKVLCMTLLDNLNDKNLALSHQKKTNRILATKIAELEQRFENLAGLGSSSTEGGFSAAMYLLHGYCPSMVDSSTSNEDDFKALTHQKDNKCSPTLNGTLKNHCKNQINGESAVSSGPEESLKTVHAYHSDDGMSFLSTESGRSILSSEYDIVNDQANESELSKLTNATLFTYKTPSSASDSGGKLTTTNMVSNSIVKQRNDDLKDLPPELAALVQKALYELDLRDFDEVVDLCEDIDPEACEEIKTEDNFVVNNVEKTFSETNAETPGATLNLIPAN
uniref:Uncharacterized protein n=1 Tax=Glossina pallidipes TaxID=7398 RepID=A0A1A9ZNV0_GLOPL